MKLLNSDIKQYKRLYRKYFSEDLDDNVARQQLTHLIRQMEIVYHPITQAQLDSYIQKYIKESKGYERKDSH